VLVKKKKQEIKTTQVAEVIIDRVNLLEKIRGSEAKDNKVIKIVEKIKRAKVKILRDKKYKKLLVAWDY